MRKFCYLLLLCTISVGVLLAQTGRITVTGTVISAEDGLPMIGASISVPGTNIGTATDPDGKFSLSLPENIKKLTVSYIGMKTQEVNVAAKMEIVLDSDSELLSEVVVTAMGITREKKSLGYAIQEVKSEELTKAGQMNVTTALTGKIAGVQVNQFGGTVGASSRISIRGNSSLNTGTQPMIVVDGIPIANDTQRSGDNTYTGVDFGSGLNDINPEDIETITVLKGGSAALYGMRAGNGVILITTKSGKGKSRGVVVSYDGNVTMDRVANIPKLQNSYGQGYYGDEYHHSIYGSGMSYKDYAEQNGFGYVDGAGGGLNDGIDESWGPRLDVGLRIPQYDSPIVGGVRQATDWVSHPNNVRDFFRTGYSMNHSVSAMSQTDNSSTRVSLSYRNQEGTVPNTDQRRYSGQFNTEMKISSKVSFDINANYTRTESANLVTQGYNSDNPINGLVLWSARQMNMETLKQNWDQKNEQGEYTLYNWNSNYHLNPYFTVNENTNTLQRDRFFAKSSLYYQPFEFLKFEGRMGYDFYNHKIFQKRLVEYSEYPEGGFRHLTTTNTELNLDFLASFNKRFNDFSVYVMAGANYRDENREAITLGAKTLTLPGVYTITNRVGDPETGMSHSTIRSNSVFANASIGWRDQLYVDMSARNDWSSTIRDDFFYPSVSLSWIPTQTIPGLKNDILTFLKLRGVLAEVGNATTAYRNRAVYNAVSNSFNGTTQLSKSMTYPNAGLRPENIRTWEVGIDAGFFDDRLHIDFAYYYKTTTDQIMNVSTTNTAGFTAMLLNAGEIENKGIEIQLRGDIFRNRDGFNWSTYINYGKDRSKIIELYPELDINTYGIGWTWGIATQARKGEKWGALVGDAYDRDETGAIKVTQTGLIARKSSQIIGNVTPDFLGGWRNEFSYKNLSFGFLFDLRVGGDIWSQSMSHSYTAGTAAITAENGIRERAIVAGVDVMKDERFVMNDGNGNWVKNTIETDALTWFESGGVAEMYVFDGSYLKLREANLTYVVPSSVLRKFKNISRATISIIGSNLALLWVHDSNTLRLDPEVGGVSSDARGVGFEQASTPNSRSFGLKLGLTF